MTNWDLFWLKLTGNVGDASAGLPVSAVLLDLSSGTVEGAGNCLARFMHHFGDVSTVFFAFGNTPQTVNANVYDKDGNGHPAPWCEESDAPRPPVRRQKGNHR
jgi:hypothetical protein